MALPFLPGNSFNRNLGKEKFQKSHLFIANNKVPYFYGDNKPGIGGDPLPGQRIDAPTSTFPTGTGPALAPWLAFDKQVLSFDAYFQESVHECRDEQYRIRRCKIYFYPEDDTIQVVEPRISNTGIAQGTIIRRHRISKPPPNDHLFYTVDDFNVGQELTLYGRRLRIVACDAFTANFLRKLGVRLGEPEPVPDDPYSIGRKAMTESMQPLRPYERKDTLRQFLDHDRHVLRFYCFWDDTDALYGDAREMVLHYFLADDTIEIREVIPANSGRDGTPCFLKRAKLPKKVNPLPLPGTVTDRTLLNVFGHPQRGGRFILDSLQMGAYSEDFYTDRDLTLGASLNVLGRRFLICDCDEFTKEYYRTKYGIRDFTPIKPAIPNNHVTVKRDIPPYNGWGSEEDTLANCKSFILPTPRGNFLKFMANDSRGFESNILRFHARLLSDSPLDNDRVFIVSCFLADDTLHIFEPHIRNSGFIGGTFLERGRVKKPGYERFSVDPPDYYGPTDLYVGAILDVNSFKFELYEADEYAYEYMEKNSSKFPYADIQSILAKLKPYISDRCEELWKFAQGQDPLSTGTLTFDEMKCLIEQLTNQSNVLYPHEYITIARHYAPIKPSEISSQILLGLAQQQLRKVGFENFQELLLACRQADLDRTGELDRAELRRICMAQHLPLPNDMLNTIMDYSATQSGKIRYELFLNQLNWRCETVGAPVEVPCDFSGNLELDWLPVSKGEPPNTEEGMHMRIHAYKVDRIVYQPFFDDLCGVPNRCRD